MLNIFKIIDYGIKGKEGYNAPDELIADTSFGLIEGFFIISFFVLGIVSGALLYFGISFGYNLMVVFGVLFLIILIIDIAIYQFIKKIVQNISTKVTNGVRNQINEKNTIEVDGFEVK